MESAATQERPRPSWFIRLIMVSFRVLFLTLLFTGLGMALGLFTGIMTTVIGGAFAHHPLDLTRAYKVFAIPTAIVVGSCTFLYNVFRAVQNAFKKA